MRRLTLLLLSMALGCSAMRGAWSSRTPLVGEDGSDTWWRIKCHKDDDGCLMQSAWACPHGYEVKDKDAGPLNTYLLISCKGESSRRVPSRLDWAVEDVRPQQDDM